jgi:hypothetical protein
MLRPLPVVPLLATAALAAVEVHVAPGGDDANPGDAARPVASLTRAREAVRQAVAAGLTRDVTVVLAAGTYELPATLEFGPGDGGTAEHAVTYAAAPGAAPVLSGGRRLAGWQRGAGPLWTTLVPEVRAGTWYFHQLWVNGRRAPRARTPNEDAPQPCVSLQGASLSADLSAHTYTFAPGQLAAWKNLGDVEAIVFGEWEITRKRFAAVDPATGVAQMAGPHGEPHPAMLPKAGLWAYLENAGEFLDVPGEWYLDRQTGVLSYWPRAGEDMTTAVVVAPRLTRLIVVRGTPETPVRNLHFQGLEVAYSDWAMPPGGYLGVQATHFTTGGGFSESGWNRIDAAVTWDGAEQCSFSDGVLRHLGGAGLALNTRCRGSRVEGNLVTDISANGINAGGPHEVADVPQDTRIANNHVYACGLGYAGAVGIWVGLAQRTEVSHNLVHDLPYTGISVGWQWDPQPSAARENTIAFNHIHHVMTRLGDGGGIYTLGLQPGSLIRGNHIHDVQRSAYAQASPNNGIFFDQGSTGFRVEDNVIYGTSGEPLRFNQTGREALTWGENHLGVAPDAVGNAAEAARAMRDVTSKAGLEAAYQSRFAPTP